MKRKLESSSISLRFIVYKEGNKFRSICLETNIAVRANSINQLHQKNNDASSLYFRSFTEEEIINKAYIRRAPNKYFVHWYLGHIIIWAKGLKTDTAEFDQHSGKLSFA